VVALLLASAFIGMFFGAITLGRIADRMGRRRAFLLSLGIYSTFSLLSAFSPDPAMLVVTRFFAGLGIGAEPPIADSYLSDLLPPRQRGRYIAWAYTIGLLGVPASGFLARGLAPIAPFCIEGWRWMFVIGALGSVVVAFLRRSLPESPRWLAANGRGDEADAVVRRFETDVPDLPEPDPVHAAPLRDRGSFAPLERAAAVHPAAGARRVRAGRDVRGRVRGHGRRGARHRFARTTQHRARPGVGQHRRFRYQGPRPSRRPSVAACTCFVSCSSRRRCRWVRHRSATIS